MTWRVLIYSLRRASIFHCLGEFMRSFPVANLKKIQPFLLVAALCSFFPALSYSEEAGSLNLPVIEKMMPNGLRVLIVERPGVPVVSFSYMQPVGAQTRPKARLASPTCSNTGCLKVPRPSGPRTIRGKNP